MKMLDKNLTPIEIGSQVKICHCIGPYGQTQIVEGEVHEIDIYHGITLKLTSPATWYGKNCRERRDVGALFYVAIKGEVHEGALVCSHEHHDFEHGHKTWVEVVILT
jgi:hypothetical protein